MTQFNNIDQLYNQWRNRDGSVGNYLVQPGQQQGQQQQSQPQSSGYGGPMSWMNPGQGRQSQPPGNSQAMNNPYHPANRQQPPAQPNAQGGQLPPMPQPGGFNSPQSGAQSSGFSPPPSFDVPQFQAGTDVYGNTRQSMGNINVPNVSAGRWGSWNAPGNDRVTSALDQLGQQIDWQGYNAPQMERDRMADREVLTPDKLEFTRSRASQQAMAPYLRMQQELSQQNSARGGRADPRAGAALDARMQIAAAGQGNAAASQAVSDAIWNQAAHERELEGMANQRMGMGIQGEGLRLSDLQAKAGMNQQERFGRAGQEQAFRGMLGQEGLSARGQDLTARGQNIDAQRSNQQAALARMEQELGLGQLGLGQRAQDYGQQNFLSNLGLEKYQTDTGQQLGMRGQDIQRELGMGGLGAEWGRIGAGERASARDAASREMIEGGRLAEQARDRELRERLGMAGLDLQGELGRGQLGLQTELGRGQLGLGRDQLGEQGRQFDENLSFQNESMRNANRQNALSRQTAEEMQRYATEAGNPMANFNQQLNRLTGGGGNGLPPMPNIFGGGGVDIFGQPQNNLRQMLDLFARYNYLG